MLNNLALYKRLDKSLDKKIERIHRQSFYNVGIIAIPALIAWVCVIVTSNSIRFFISFYLFVVFLFCFAPIRMIFRPLVKQLCIFSFNRGVPYLINDPKKKVSNFLSDYSSYVKELVILRSIIDSTDNDTIDLYIVIVKNELKEIQIVLSDIKRILDHDEYRSKINDIPLLEVQYLKLKAYLCNLIQDVIAKKEGSQSDKNDIISEIYEQIKSIRCDL